MSDEKRRIFTHPDIVQAGHFKDRYDPGLQCTVCNKQWAEHFGWGCETAGHWQDTLPTITTTCARCSATIDPAAVEQHHAVCFRVGDYVRWENEYETKWHASDPRWFEGAVTKVYPSGPRDIGVSVRIEDGSFQYRPGDHVSYVNAANLGHIKRLEEVVRDAQERFVRENPQPALMCQDDRELEDVLDRILPLPEQPTLSSRLGHLKHGPGGSGLSGPCDADCRKCEIERNTTRAGRIQAITELAYDGKITGEQARELLTSPDLEPTAPTLYDGLTAMECYMRWCDNRACVERGGRPLYDLTPVQIAEGRATYPYDLAAHWPLNLAARISAAKERERLTVCMPIDAEDLPW